MKRNIIIFVFISASIILNSRNLFSAIILPGEGNSTALAAELSSEILKNPSGDLVPFYIDKLIELAPAAGRLKTSIKFKEAINKLLAEGENAGFTLPVLRLSIDELNNSYSESIKHFSIIKNWNISGPWKLYGKPDIDHEFNPETVYKIEEIEKGRNFSAGEDGVIFPYKFQHKADETYYATYSFTTDSSVIVWILSDAQYKLIINGREAAGNRVKGKQVVKAFSLSGARGYTVQVKMMSYDAVHQPFIRGMITDEKFRPVKLVNSRVIFNNQYKSKKIFSSDESGESIPQEAEILTTRMKELIQSGNYIEGYKLGVSITKKFPSYFGAYKEFIPLLDIMNRDEELLEAVKNFRNLFPDSDIYSGWLAEFYKTRDRVKFAGIMKTVPLYYLSEKSIEAYVHLLCGEKEYSQALKLCLSLKANPFFRHIIPEVIKGSGDLDLWRKTLIEYAALRDEAATYYGLGLAEMQIGLDPVMYWRKGYSLDDDSGMMRDLSDLYENGILGANDFYSGVYTDLHPEFRWKAKRRKVSIHIFESGRVFIDGEDIIPSGKLIRNEKFEDGGTGFSSGEIKTALPYIDGLKILYVLKAKDGFPSTVDFNSSLTDKQTDKKRIIVNYKISGEEEFSVVKYSGEYLNNELNAFTVLKNIILKSEDENISELDYEVICHGDFEHRVRYKDKSLSAGRYSEGITRTWINERFSDGDNESIDSEILNFSSEKIFDASYNKVIKYAGQLPEAEDTASSGKENKEKILKAVHFYIMSSISKTGNIDLNPDKIEYFLKNGKGTVEERTLLAKAILDNKGIKSFLSFGKNKDGLINKILLYVPGNGDSVYWLNFYGEGILNKMESGSDAIVITGEGIKTFPVNPETYIR